MAITICWYIFKWIWIYVLPTLTAKKKNKQNKHINIPTDLLLLGCIVCVFVHWALTLVSPSTYSLVVVAFSYFFLFHLIFSSYDFFHFFYPFALLFFHFIWTALANFFSLLQTLDPFDLNSKANLFVAIIEL